MNTKDGGPAFPSANEVRLGDYGTTGHAGMSLRDYFAGKVIQGLMCNTQRTDAIINVINDGQPIASAYAQYCYEMADAMLKAREGK